MVLNLPGEFSVGQKALEIVSVEEDGSFVLVYASWRDHAWVIPLLHQGYRDSSLIGGRTSVMISLEGN